MPVCFLRVIAGPSPEGLSVCSGLKLTKLTKQWDTAGRELIHVFDLTDPSRGGKRGRRRCIMLQTVIQYM